jgi:hypothetical protein
MIMAQWRVMNAYDLEDDLPVAAPSQHVPHHGPLPPEGGYTASGFAAPIVGAVLGGMVRHPVRQLIRRWNWKSALLSCFLRATSFFFTNLIAGWHAAFGAMLAELALRPIANDQNSWPAEASGGSFAKSVRQIFDDECARQSKVSRAVDTAHEFSWSRTTAKFFDLYDGLHMRFRDSAGQRFMPFRQAESSNLAELNKRPASDGILPGTGFGKCGSGENSI